MLVFRRKSTVSLYLPIEWTKEQIIDLLDLRIGALVRERYTTRAVTHRDLLPGKISKQASIDYILERTLMRPRDVILFFNLCISQAVDNPSITAQMVRRAGGEYSRLRLRSLADEWGSDYPTLLSFVDLLKGRPSCFPLDSISDDDCLNLCVKLHEIRESNRRTIFRGRHSSLVDAALSCDDFRRAIMVAFYKVSLVGLKLEHYERVSWSIGGRRSVSAAEIQPATRIAVPSVFLADARNKGTRKPCRGAHWPLRGARVHSSARYTACPIIGGGSPSYAGSKEAEARFNSEGFTRRLSAALPRYCTGLWRSGCGTAEVVAFPVVALPKSLEGWGCGIPCLAKDARPFDSSLRAGYGAPAGLKPGFLSGGLYAALKRRSSTSLLAARLKSCPCRSWRSPNLQRNEAVESHVSQRTRDIALAGLKPGSFREGFTRRLSAALPRHCTGLWRSGWHG